MSFDEIFGLAAGLYFYLYVVYETSTRYIIDYGGFEPATPTLVETRHTYCELHRWSTQET